MGLIELPVAIGEVLDNGSGPLPDPDLVNFYKLAEKRIIYLDFDIDIDVMAIHRQIMLWNMEDKELEPDQRQPIKLVIYSPGGYMGHMWSIVDLINASKTPVWTVNIGQASSAAFLMSAALGTLSLLPNTVWLPVTVTDSIRSPAASVVFV